jgi:cellulose synthase (UDP-forming)
MIRRSFSGLRHFIGEHPHWDDTLLSMPVWSRTWVRRLLAAVTVVLFILTVTVELDLWQQLLFSFCSMAFGVLLFQIRRRLVTVMMAALSVSVSARYIYWRITSTAVFVSPADKFFGYMLLFAELYAFTVMMLSYFQTIWPLHRKPVPLPADMAQWPSVDVFIPTYNETLDVVRQSVLAALELDWPADRLRVYVLDDGRRPEFRAFCEEVGAEYLTRPDNLHAKAGNINAALARTSGDFVVVFDCDHIPTRSFLQICMGWFLKDPKLAMLQTPHVFYSPDPFEHNLGTFRKVPNEGELFYGVTQDGNDLWNATFFCGSCGVMRRSALDAVGGIAVGSVTEDALTALMMNSKGLNTAYLAVPQAAGLATETLARHIGQRMRWARGMAEIFRDNNPLLCKGLSLPQRLCYLSAMLHFFFGLPRMVFLVAPLGYLFFGAHLFHASALMVMAYALPHVVLANLSGSRIQGRFRHSFWNEVYETVLAWYLLGPVLQALLRPGSKGFNVTDKGGVIRESFFEWSLARPYIVLLVVNLVGFAAGLVSLLVQPGLDVRLTVLLNLFWTFYNIVVASAAVGVASEEKQMRQTPRVQMDLPAALCMPDGRRIVCRTADFSQGGLGLMLPQGVPLPQRGDEVSVSIFRNEYEAVLPAEVSNGRGRMVGLSFHDLTLEQEQDLARVTFARADAWTDFWGHKEPDDPLVALGRIARVGLKGFGVLMRYLFSWSVGYLTHAVVSRPAAGNLETKQI